jgi:ABC-type hemin transport system substrate-binding protein
VSDDEQYSQQLTVMMTEIATKMQVLLDKQDELAENINKIKEAVYNPDKGLYARLSKLDARLDALESWKNNNTKILWIIVTVGVGLVLSTIWQTVF